MQKALVTGALLSALHVKYTQSEVQWFGGREDFTTRLQLSDGAYGSTSSPSNAYGNTPNVPSSNRPDNYPKCKWAPSFAYEIKSANVVGESKTKCFPNVFAVGGELQYPYPRSSYNYDLDPPLFGGDKPDQANGYNALVGGAGKDLYPRIHVDVDNMNAAASPNVSTNYPWKFYEDAGGDLLYGLVAKTAGLYRLKLTAYDWDRSSKVCDTWLSVTDMFRPQQDVSMCPKGAIASYSSLSIANAKATTESLWKFRSTANNNACSDERCDVVKMKRVDFFQDTNAEIDSSGTQCTQPQPTEWSKCLDSPMSESAWTKMKQNPLSLSKCEPEIDTTKNCKRTCSYEVTLKEFYTPYCAPSGTKVCPEAKRTCDGGAGIGQSCKLEQTLTAVGTDLIKSISVALVDSKNRKPAPIENPKEMFPDSNYTKPSDLKELHFDDSDCDEESSDYNKFCKISFKLSDMFSLNAELSADASMQSIIPVNANAKDIVFWRVRKSITGPWQMVTKGDLTDKLSFDALSTIIQFQAWTQCGQVGDTITWTIFVHRHEEIQVDRWWNSMWNCGSCNYENSDFSPIQFNFDTECPMYKKLGNSNDDDGDDDDDDEDSDALLLSSSKVHRHHRKENKRRFLADSPSGVAKVTVVADPNQKPVTLSEPKPVTLSEPKPVTLSEPKPDQGKNVNIGWIFNGFQCYWKYKDLKPSEMWLNTKDASKQTGVKMQFAVKLLNQAVTEISATCDFYFKTANGKKSMKVTRDRCMSLKNCDAPRFDVEHATDRGVFVKTCPNTWLANASRQPSPFQACSGNLVFPSAPSGGNTVYLKPQSSLTCCNDNDQIAPIAATFKCTALTGDWSALGRCTDTTSVAGYNMVLSAESSSNLFSSSWLSSIYMTSGLFVVGVIAVFVVRHRQSQSEEESFLIEEGYSPLLG